MINHQVGQLDRTNVYPPKAVQGFTIVELMVALTLGLILVAGVIQVFVGNRQVQQMEQAMTGVQENGRFALKMMGDDIRAAGFYGCSPPFGRTNNSNPVNATTNHFEILADGLVFTDGDDFAENMIIGSERLTSGVFDPALPADLTGANNVSTMARNGSDIIRVVFGRRIAGLELAATVTRNQTAAVRVIDNSRCLQQDDVVIIANCVNASLFRITNTPLCDGNPTDFEHIQGLNQNTTNEIAFRYAPGDTWSMQLIQSTWFVADTGRNNPSGQDIYALYRKFDNAAPEEMLEGVEYLKLEFGEAVGNSEPPNIRYVSAGENNLDMRNIVSVKVGLLMQSYEGVLDFNDTRTYSLPGQDIAATGTTITHSGGRSLRKAFVETIKVRNRAVD